MKPSLIDLAGMKFGRLTVLEKHGQFKNSMGKNKGTLWLCQCSCGNMPIVRSESLRKNMVVSCGCHSQEKASKDITNKRFGKLVTIKKISRSTKVRNYRLPSKWLCQCDCGNQKTITVSSLTSGAVTSCGCSKESGLASGLKKYFIEIYSGIPEYPAFRNPKTNVYLRYDIFLPHHNVFIEVQGIQHYSFIEYFHRTKKNFIHSKYLDALKKSYATQNGTYISIDMRKIKTVEEAIIYIEERL